MKYLALDTSGQACSVALDMDGQRSQSLETSGRQHARRLPGMVWELLAENGLDPSQLDGLVCCVGPGGFASVRVGVAYVKGLAFGLDLPVAPVSSLALLAEGVRKRHGVRRVLAALDARMGEVYVGNYRYQQDGGLTVDKERVCRPDQVDFASDGHEAWDREACIGAGSGWHRYEAELRAACGDRGTGLEVDSSALPEARHAFDIVALQGPRVFVSAAELQPGYLRNRVAKTVAERAREAGIKN